MNCQTIVGAPMVAAVAFLSSFAPAIESRGEQLPDKVRTALQKNSEAMSPLSIRWTEHDRTVNSDGTTDEISVESEWTWQDPLFRYTSVIDRTALSNDAISEKLTNKLGFNGSILFFDSGFGVRNSSIDVFTHGQPKARLFDVRYMDAVGIYVPSKNDELATAKLQSKLIYQLDQEGTVESIDPNGVGESNMPVMMVSVIAKNPKWESLNENDQIGPMRKSVEAGSVSKKNLDDLIASVAARKANTPEKYRYIYYLAPSFGFAVVKYEQRTLDDQLAVRCENREMSPMADREIWLPKSVVLEEFEVEQPDYSIVYNQTPVRTHRFSLASFRGDSNPTGFFELKQDDIEPGRIVIDDMNPQLRLPDGQTAMYVMPANPNHMNLAIAQAMQKNAPPKPYRYGYLITGIGLLFFAIAAHLLAKKWG